MQEFGTKAKGIVYVLVNEAMPGYVKIGYTSKSLEQRIRELSASTSVPLPFTCSYACTVEDMGFVEGQLHDAFDDNRINPKREFFKIAPERVVAALKLAGARISHPRKISLNPKKINMLSTKQGKNEVSSILGWSISRVEQN